MALIFVDADGENQIVVVPGANAAVRPTSPGGAVLCQLEVPDEVVLAAAADGASFFALNAAPARPIDLEPDLLIVNRLEHEVVSRGKLVAVTYGAEGAVLYEDGREVARARPAARSTPSTAPRPATRSPRASSSRCSRGVRTTTRCAAPAPPARSPRRGSVRSPRCRPRRRLTAILGE